MSPVGAMLAHDVHGAPGAPLLVLGTSLGTTRDMWAPALATFSQHFRVIRFEHPGHGDSASPQAEWYTIDELGRDVLRVLDRLDTRPFSYAGVSLGGMVGLWLAQHVPQRVQGLAVCCSSAHPGNPTKWQDRAAIVRHSGLAGIRDAVLSSWFTPAWAAEHPDEVGRFGVALTEAMDPGGYATCCDVLSRLDLRDGLNSITAPTLVLAGSADEALPLPHSQLLARAIPAARLEVVPAAHLATVELPDVCTPLLVDHLLPETGGAT